MKIYLVAETLGCNNGNLVADALVGLEVEGELGVVPLNDDLGGLLDGLGTDTTHFGGGCGGLVMRVVVGEEWVNRRQVVSVRVYLKKFGLSRRSRVMSQQYVRVGGERIRAKGYT